MTSIRPGGRAGSASCRRRTRLVALVALLASPLAAVLTLGAPGLVVGAGATGGCPAPGHESPTVRFGAPVWTSCFAGTITQSSPTFATYDGESVVAVGDERGYVHLLDAQTGAELPGWPAQVATGGEPAAIESSPTIAYLDGPHRPPSIIVGTGSTWTKSKVGEVEAFNWNGSERFVFHVGHQPGTAVGVISSPAVGSLAGNGQQDIVFGSWDHHLYALGPSGKLLPGFPFNNGDTIWSSPALYQLPGTRGATIFLGSDASGLLYHQGGPALLQCRSGGFVGAYRYVADRVVPIWRNCLNQSVWSSPAVGTLIDHRAAVVVGTSFFEQPFPSATNHIFAFWANNGRPVPHWPVETSGPVLGSPAIGLIAPGREAVVDTSWECSNTSEGSCTTSNSSRITAYSPGGRVYWSQILRGPQSFASPVLVPLRGETSNDVLIGSSFGLYPLSGRTGGYLFGTGYANQFATLNSGCRVFNSVAVGEVPPAPGAPAGADGSWYVFEACGGPPAIGHPGEVSAYRLRAPGTSPAWPMFRQNPAHTGLAPRVLPPIGS